MPASSIRAASVAAQSSTTVRPSTVSTRQPASTPSRPASPRTWRTPHTRTHSHTRRYARTRTALALGVDVDDECAVECHADRPVPEPDLPQSLPVWSDGQDKIRIRCAAARWSRAKALVQASGNGAFCLLSFLFFLLFSGWFGLCCVGVFGGCVVVFAPPCPFGLVKALYRRLLFALQRPMAAKHGGCGAFASGRLCSR